MLKIGIIGLASVSEVHIKAIEKIEYANLIAATDIDKTKKSLLKEGQTFYANAKEMLENEKLDCVHICLPHFLNTENCLLAAQYGVNVFMEKPIALNPIDASSLDAIDDKIKVGVCFQNRYNETVQMAKKIIDSQKYGKPKGIKGIMTWHRSEEYFLNSWIGKKELSGGGVMTSMGIHTLDILYYLMGDVKWVHGYTGNFLHSKIDVEDTAIAHLAFQNGANGIFYSTVTYARDAAVDIEIVLETAVLSIADGKLILKTENANSEILAYDGQNSPKKTSEWGDKHFEAIYDFYNALLNKNSSYITISEAKKATEIIYAIEKSKSEGRYYL